MISLPRALSAIPVIPMILMATLLLALPKANAQQIPPNVSPPNPQGNNNVDPRTVLPPVFGPEATMYDLGLSQEAWENAEKHIAPGQSRPGYRRYVYNPAETFIVYARTGMITNIVLDPAEEIGTFNISDPSGFEGFSPLSNIIQVRPLAAGIDSNLNLITRAGNLYTFVLRSYPHTYRYTPDMRVEVDLPRPGQTAVEADITQGAKPAPRAIWEQPIFHPESGEPIQTQTGTLGVPPDPIHGSPQAQQARALASLARNRLHVEDPDPYRAWGNLASLPFDPAALIYNDRFMRASTHEAGEILAPEMITRDSQFTYLHYGAKALSILEWPVVTEISGNTEQEVAYRTAGNGTILVVESVRYLVLRSGPHWLCIIPKDDYQGPPNNNPRNQIAHENTYVSPIIQNAIQNPSLPHARTHPVLRPSNIEPDPWPPRRGQRTILVPPEPVPVAPQPATRPMATLTTNYQGTKEQLQALLRMERTPWSRITGTPGDWSVHHVDYHEARGACARIAGANAGCQIRKRTPRNNP